VATTIGELLAERAARDPERACVSCDGEVWSYREMEERAARVTGGLRRFGLDPGGRVCLMLPNGLPFLAAWFGIERLGAVAVPINTAYRGELLGYVLNNSGASVVVIGEEYLDRLAFVEDGVPALEHVVVVPSMSPPASRPSLRWDMTEFDTLLEGPPGEPGGVGETDAAVIMYTSGTTGPSKGAVLCHRGLLTFAENHATQCGLTREDVCYTCLPLFHAIALVLTTVGGMLVGARVAVGTRFRASTFWDEIRASGATYASITGSIAQILYKQPPHNGDRQHQLRIAYAIPAPAAIYTECERRFGISFIEAYGATDGQIPIYMPLDAPRIGACGRLIPGFDLRIVDDADEPLGPRQVGEIVYRSLRPYTMMLGYHGNPQATLDAVRNFWFHSGDLGYLDEEGYLYFVDRKKDSLRRRGENISSYEVEKVVNAHPAVLESAAVGVPSELGEDDVKIVVVLRPGDALEPETLMAWCEKRLPYFMVPRYVAYADALPKTPNEKVQKYRLREAGVEGAWDREKSGYRISR
jgi:crotonobetaine/carnitine-CoA ligase